MTSLVDLTDVEAALVGGGAITQTISVSVLQQHTSTVSSTATHVGRVSVTVVGGRVIATAVGEESSNAAVVLPVNVVEVLNLFRLGLL
jgi:hypothetical protein